MSTVIVSNRMHMLYDVRVLNIVCSVLSDPNRSICNTSRCNSRDIARKYHKHYQLQMCHIVCVAMNMFHINIYVYAVVHLREIVVHARSYNLWALHSSCDIRLGELCGNKLSNPSGLV